MQVAGRKCSQFKRNSRCFDLATTSSLSVRAWRMMIGCESLFSASYTSNTGTRADIFHFCPRYSTRGISSLPAALTPISWNVGRWLNVSQIHRFAFSFLVPVAARTLLFLGILFHGSYLENSRLNSQPLPFMTLSSASHHNISRISIHMSQL
jgi:hypothetical protein